MISVLTGPSAEQHDNMAGEESGAIFAGYIDCYAGILCVIYHYYHHRYHKSKGRADVENADGGEESNGT